MDRLCPKLFIIVAFAFLSYGCVGQNVEGAWRGPFPFEGASDCRVRLATNSKFDLTCKGDPGWVGAGRYERHGDRLTFRFEALSRRGEIERQPPEVQLRLEGRGNEMVLSVPNGRPMTWNRLPPG